MNLASELSGDDALTRIRDRVTAYSGRQWQRRLISTLGGILLDNVANDGGDVVLDVSAEAGVDGDFGAVPVIRAAATLGDAMEQLRPIAMHSTIYTAALENDLIEFTPQSEAKPIRIFRGLQVVVDDCLPVDDGDSAYTSVLFGLGALGFGASEQRVGPGTEIERKPGSGNGGGQTILHSRMNMAGHPSDSSGPRRTSSRRVRELRSLQSRRTGIACLQASRAARIPHFAGRRDCSEHVNFPATRIRAACAEPGGLPLQSRGRLPRGCTR
jgi:hypothetical protein